MLYELIIKFYNKSVYISELYAYGSVYTKFQFNNMMHYRELYK